MDHFAVILAGGKGERFWPLSTAQRPKQFLSLVGEGTLLEQAVRRLDKLIPPERIFVVTGREQLTAARMAARALPPEQIIGEPMGRDTAASIALGAALVGARAPEAAFVVLTADHIIGEESRFQATLRACLELACAQPVLVTLGITPTDPSTAYGYLEVGDLLDKTNPQVPFWRVRRFVEKPDAGTAAGFMATGNFFWNAGMFIWSVPTLRAAFSAQRPALEALYVELTAAIQSDILDDTLDRLYPGLERVSIDYALMERARNVVMARGDFPWDDVGSWDALTRHYPADELGNIQVGTSLCLDAANNLVMAPTGLTVLIGVQELIVVQTGGATLVCARSRAQDVKRAVQALQANPESAKFL